MPVPPAEMLLFAAVVREGGFSRAARALGVTKQTVSERVAKLEERLGVRLLERTTRRLRPTEAGAAYAERCAAIAAQIEEANQEVHARQAEPSGTLRVSAPVLYGRSFLVDVVREALARHPRLRIGVALSDRRVDLVEEGFDLAIRVGPVDDASLTVKRLGEGFVYAVASPALLARGAPAAPADLARLPTIGFRERETWAVGGARTKVDPALVVNDHVLARDAALAGIGVALLPSLVVREAVRDGRLVVLFGPEPAARVPVSAVFPTRRYLPPKVRVFLDLLVERVAPMAALDGPAPVPAGG